MDDLLAIFENYGDWDKEGVGTYLAKNKHWGWWAQIMQVEYEPGKKRYEVRGQTRPQYEEPEPEPQKKTSKLNLRRD